VKINAARRKVDFVYFAMNVQNSTLKESIQTMNDQKSGSCLDGRNFIHFAVLTASLGRDACFYAIL